MIVAIDGPAGSGKSTLAHYISRMRDIAYLDTGALYRALTAYALYREVDPACQLEVEALAQQSVITMVPDDGVEGSLRIYVDDLEVTSQIRTPQVERFVSQVSSYPGVRSALLQTQRAIADTQSVVAEGRDIGTVVFPHADLKIFLMADAQTRAQRRVAQNKMRARTGNVALDPEAFDETYIQEQIEQRDKSDSTRELAPLKPHPDAVHIDTSSKTLEELQREVLALVDRVMDGR